MRVVRDALYSRLVAVSGLTTVLSTFRGAPAIFNEGLVPPSAEGRYVVIREAAIDIPFESKQAADAPSDYVPSVGRYLEHDIGCYEPDTGDSSGLEDLALLIRDSLHRHPLSISGYGTLIAKALGPVNAPRGETDEIYDNGRIVTVALTIIKAP